MQQESTIKLTRRYQGFTIIELLIVIVIIGILVAIVAVGYNGITGKAKEATLKSDLKNAATQLSVDLAKTGTHPGTDGVKTDGGSLSKSPGTTFQYTRSEGGKAYCLTATTPGVPAFMVSSDNTAPREGTCSGHTGPSTGSSEIANNTPIQDVTSSQCQALPTYTGSNESALRTVTDSRGGTTRSYRIGKLADNNCWMLDNLTLGDLGMSITLTPEDTNLTTEIDSFTLPKLYAFSLGSYRSFNTPFAYGPVPGDTGIGTTKYGYLYNWSAATAGETQSSMPAGNGNAPNSICPANWRLPTGGNTSSDFAKLDKAFGGTGHYAENGPSQEKWLPSGSFKGTLSGFWSNGFSGQSSWGSLWSSSVHSSDPYYAFFAGFESDGIGPGDSNNNRDEGRAVRCLLN